jgi:hypothetical protein
MHAIKLHHRIEVTVRHAWFKLKTLLRLNTGVDKNFFAGDAAIRLSRGILPQGVRITCAGRRDGLGKQATARISGLNFAKAFGATYVDSPFVRLGHSPGDMKSWVTAWENRFNFGKDEERIGDRPYRVIDYADYLLNGHEITDDVVLRFQQCYWFNRRYPDSFQAIAGSLRDKFGAASRKPDRQRLIVAVHVRRGDVSANKNAQRFTPNTSILHTITSLRTILDDMGVTPVLQVFSEGKADDFADFARAGCELHLDTDALWTMQQLVEADVLVMAKSSFSYIAAILNAGVKIYEPNFDPPQSTWVVRSRDGSFDKLRLRERLDAYLGADRSRPTPERQSLSA